MLSRMFLLFLLSFGITITFSQTGNNEFGKYALRQDSLFMDAYKKKNAKQYDALMADFVTRYNALSDKEKKNYQRNLAGAYYNFSCTYALLNNKPMALDYLDKSVKAGYYNYANIMADTDMDNIRAEGRFKTIIASIRGIGDYRYILKRAAAYNIKDSRPIPTFTYQPADNPNLVILRKAFKLDSVAGTGNEVSRIINMLHWIHNLIPHDGNHENPVVKNAMSMIAECKKDNRGLNCRGLSTVLNECYLAMGFKSRFVTCFPKDSLGIDFDCHVINMVYAPSLKKWIWIDPTNDAYVMNEKGELLSIEEVRERIINNKMLIVNPDANWNHKSSVTKNDYLYNYMAKNLYMLECHSNSEYDAETRGQDKTETYVRLLPLEYFKQGKDKTEYNNKNTRTTFINYTTNNPNVFWALPQ